MKRVTIILPCFQEAEALASLLPEIRRELSSRAYEPSIVLVNDFGSADAALDALCAQYQAHCLNVPFHMGHQEAILYGLRKCLFDAETAIETKERADYFVTMDADGQDDPKAIADLIERASPGTIAVAQRIGLRPEGWRFRVLHAIFKLGFRTLCGFTPDFGNFAAFSEPVARRIARSPDCDTCYAMSLPLVAPINRLPVVRRSRVGGHSRIGFAGLFDHGLRLLLPHLRAISRRLAIYSVFLGAASLLTASVAIFLKFFFPERAFPNWATLITIGALIICLQLITGCAVLFLFTSVSRQVSVLARMSHLIRRDSPTREH
jgi:glycosyltransferase involved in cell wall biosynthesis